MHPRLEGLRKLHNHTLRLLAFNKRKLSATYYYPDFRKEVPAVWIDRAGIKASIVEVTFPTVPSKRCYQFFQRAVDCFEVIFSGLNFCPFLQKLSRQSKLAYGVVLEEVATRDDVGTICKQRGSNGSPSGIEHMAFLQMKITRSNLKSGETGLIGARDIFQVRNCIRT